VFHAALGEQCEHVGISYIAFNIVVATVFQFTIGVALMRAGSRSAGEHVSAAGPSGKLPLAAAAETGAGGVSWEAASSKGGQQGQQGQAPVYGGYFAVPSLETEMQPVGGGGSEALPLAPEHLLVGEGGGLAAVEQEWLLPSAAVAGGRGGSEVSGGDRGPGPLALGSMDSDARLAGVRWWRSAGSWLQGAAPLPTQAAIAGVLVGCVPGLKALFFGPGAKLQLISDTLDMVGNGLVPTAVPLLGAIVYRWAFGGLWRGVHVEGGWGAGSIG
jgi:hypothetical protein